MAQGVSIQSFKLDEQGLAHIFGELEAKLVETVWLLGEANVQDVIDHLDKSLNYKTIMTVLNRLVEKEILQRRKSGRAFYYSAKVSRVDLLADVFDRMMRGMLDVSFREVALTQMIETAEAIDPGILDQLSHLIQQRQDDA